MDEQSGSNTGGSQSGGTGLSIDYDTDPDTLTASQRERHIDHLSPGRGSPIDEQASPRLQAGIRL